MGKFLDSTGVSRLMTKIKTALGGKVDGPSSSVNNQVAVFDGTTGKAIKGSGYTIAKSVPSDAKFTDTTYSSKTAASGGTDVSLCTTGEKYTWNNKYSKPSGGIPASDIASGVIPTVAAWAQASSKPTYNRTEIVYDTYSNYTMGGTLQIGGQVVQRYGVVGDISGIELNSSLFGNNGHSVTVFFYSADGNEHSVSINAGSGIYTPDGNDITLTVPVSGYAELNILSMGSNGSYVRGV